MSKLTPWYPPEIKPVHKGVYERDTTYGPYSYWTGDYWGGWHFSPAGAYANRDMESARQNDPWRGLARKPK